MGPYPPAPTCAAERDRGDFLNHHMSCQQLAQCIVGFNPLEANRSRYSSNSSLLSGSVPLPEVRERSGPQKLSQFSCRTFPFLGTHLTLRLWGELFPALVSSARILTPPPPSILFFFFL